MFLVSYMVIKHARSWVMNHLVCCYLLLGCQRTAFASDYYPVFTKPNTSLVTQKIVSVKADSILTEDGEEHQIDVSNF